MTRLLIEDATVGFNGSCVLDDVSLQLESGAWIGLIGPNGAGKTTLLRTVLGLASYTGTVRLDGTSVDAMSRRQIARTVAYVPQRPMIPDGMTVVDYALMGRTPYIPYLGAESARDVQIVHDALVRLELDAFADRALETLSGGEAQRALLARALVQEAPVLLLDEPTAALDMGHQQQALELVDEIRKERELTVLSAMHDLTLAAQFADDLLLLSEGRRVAFGLPKSVLTEDAIGKYFNASVRVVDDGAGGVLIIPIRAKDVSHE